MASKPEKIPANDPLGVGPADVAAIQKSTPLVVPTIRAPKLRTKTVLTLPLISMAHRELLLCYVLEEPKPADFELGPSNEHPPTIVRIVDLDTMTQALLICNALVISAFERAGGALAGRYFKIIAGQMKTGKQFSYRELSIEEMEVDSAQEK